MGFRLSLLIWVGAVLFNTILFVLFVMSMQGHPEELLLIIVAALAITAIGTLPALFLLWAVVSVCARLNLEGQKAILIVLMSSIVFAALEYFGIMAFYSIDALGYSSTLFIGMVATTLSVLFRYKALENFFSSYSNE